MDKRQFDHLPNLMADSRDISTPVPLDHLAPEKLQIFLNFTS